MEKYISDIKQQELFEKEAEKAKLNQNNLALSWLDIAFPYHMLFFSYKDTEMSTTLKFYNRQRGFMLWLHNRKF